MEKYELKNAEPVLEAVERRIKEIEDYNATKPSWRKNKRFRMVDVYDELSIFDWWTDYLSLSRLKEMRIFLKKAIKLGFTGYVCFKVGVSGCANGMWAHKEPTTTGFSPDGDFIYRSFTPDYTYWDAQIDGEFITNKTNRQYNELTSASALEKVLKEVA